MNTSAQLSIATAETILITSKKPYKKQDDGSLFLKARASSGLLYPITFTEEQGGWIFARMDFPKFPYRMKDAEGLCDFFNRAWGGRPQVCFEAEGGNFYSGNYIKPKHTKPDRFLDEIKAFADVCDSLLEMFTVHVSPEGEWNRQIVGLMTYRFDTMN